MSFQYKSSYFEIMETKSERRDLHREKALCVINGYCSYYELSVDEYIHVRRSLRMWIPVNTKKNKKEKK